MGKCNKKTRSFGSENVQCVTQVCLDVEHGANQLHIRISKHPSASDVHSGFFLTVDE